MKPLRLWREKPVVPEGFVVDMRPFFGICCFGGDYGLEVQKKRGGWSFLFFVLVKEPFWKTWFLMFLEKHPKISRLVEVKQ